MGAPDDWLLTAQRVAVHLPTATAVLADLHLGYAAARRRRGEAVPAARVADTLAPLADVLRRRQLTRIVVAGDLFEDGVDEGVLMELRAWLTDHGAELVAVVPGNHDRRLADRWRELPVVAEGLRLHRWLVVHGDQDVPDTPAVHGHFHPCVQLGRHTRPCYLVAENRIVLPAFSRDARGTVATGCRRWHGLRSLVPVGDDLLDFGEVYRAEKGAGAAGSR
jgi:putative SbcD/Mre11-related phosphoesterase